MKQIIYSITAVFLVLTSCNINKTSNTCNKRVYYTIDSALKCSEGSMEHRPLLFALVCEDADSNKKLGWDILKDKDIIASAQRDYVLIIIDPEDIKIDKDSIPKEFADIIKYTRQEPYFVVTNNAFYPFRQFYLHEDKEWIINELGVGLGP